MRWDEIPRFTSCRNYGVEWSLFRYFCEYIDHETEAGLVLNPDFQRGHVWTEEQQTAYIEYLLMGGLSGRTVYLNAKDIGSPSLKAQDYVCVDGLQRITAIRRFYRDEIPAFGHRYSQFEGKLNSIKLTIRVVLNDLQTREEVLQWYLELNMTGVPHSKSLFSIPAAHSLNVIFPAVPRCSALQDIQYFHGKTALCGEKSSAQPHILRY